MTEETKFTVFAEGGLWFNNAPICESAFRGASLQRLIELAAEWCGGTVPCAWAAEATSAYGGTKSSRQLRAESIAAGRTIDYDVANDRYVALGVEDKPKVRHHGFTCPECGSHYFGSSEWNGKFTGHCHANSHVGNGCKFEWDRNDPEAEARCMYTQSPEEWAASYVKPAAKTPTLDKLANTSEPKRPRLTWADPQRIDRFPGFTVKSDTTEVAGSSHPLARSPDLAPSSPQVLPVHGSAKLLG